MIWGEHSYSRLVALLKIILPLAALALLSTLFLLSRSMDTEVSLPFSQSEVEERLTEQRVTSPQFSGMTSAGDALSISAGLARPDAQSPGRTEAQDIIARIRTRGGTRLKLEAHTGVVDQLGDLALLSGGLSLTSSQGYRIETTGLRVALTHLFVQSEGRITGEGPPGRFSAGGMVLTRPEHSEDAHLLFTGGVRLLYNPKDDKD